MGNHLSLYLTILGADGGTVPTRDELVRVKKEEPKADARALNHARHFHCHLSNAELSAPIVCDELGNLYNKEAVVRALLEKTMPEPLRYLRSIRQLHDVKMSDNPSYDANGRGHAAAAGEETEWQDSPWHCPITLLAYGHRPFVAMRPCGCVLSAQAVEEVKDNGGGEKASAQQAAVCLICQTQLNGEAPIRLVIPDDELKKRREELLAAVDMADEEKRERKAAKKRKKEKKSKKANEDVDDEQASKRARTDSNGTSTTTTATSTTTSTSSTKANGSAPTTAFSKQSDAYKSLFTSSLKNKPNSTSHNWINASFSRH